MTTFCKVASSTSRERTEREAFIAADPMPQPVSSPSNDWRISCKPARVVKPAARPLRNATYDYVDLYRISWRDEHRKEYPKITTTDELFLSAHRILHTTKELACTYRVPMVLREWLDNKRISVAHDARQDRKSNFCDFLWRILLITHGGIKSRIACTKPLEEETLGASVD